MTFETVTARDSGLWDRLSGVPFDQPESRLDFTTRLARENGWSRRHAARAVGEYRRFAYLAVTSAHEVTPSDEVDQVWHLHLTYSRHYWGAWTEALGRPLHHGPTSGGADEAKRYLENYVATLDAYVAAFGEEPPADLWPDPAERFSAAPRMRRIDRGRYWLIPRWMVWGTVRLVLASFAALMLAGSLAGPAGLWARESWVGQLLLSEPGLANMICFFVLFFSATGLVFGLVGGLWQRVRRHGKRRRRDGSWSFATEFSSGGDSGCSGCGD